MQKKWSCKGRIAGIDLYCRILNLSSLEHGVISRDYDDFTKEYKERKLLIFRVKGFNSNNIEYDILFSKFDNHDWFCNEYRIRRTRSGRYIQV